MESQKLLCDVCGTSFTKNKNLLRHVREKHQGKKRTDNEKRKREVTDNEARKEGLLAGLYSETFGEQVRSIPQAVFKRPAEYVATVIITVLHLQFCITVIITVSDYSDYIVIITVIVYIDCFVK